MKQIQIALFLFVVAVCQLGELGYAQTLKIGMTSKTLFYLPFYVGEKRAFIKGKPERRTRPDRPHRCSTSSRCLPARSISAPLMPDSVIVVNEKGAILKVIAGVDNAAPYFLIGGRT